MEHKPRTISWFSCGAASAYATYLTVTRDQGEAVYCRVVNEHPDNLRFLDDFARVTGIPIKTIMNEQYEGNIIPVFIKRKYIKDRYGAPCTMILKKDMRKSYQMPTDIQVFGYTSEEQDRIDRFIDSNNEVNAVFPLMDKGINKGDCYSFIKSLGIELPAMYRLGYNNNNCIGCVKGGMGYWNKIRVDFPEQFNRMALVERWIGHAVNKDEKGPVFLDELDPERGRMTLYQDMPSDCGFTCESTK